jgi:hypothetical protein
LKCPSPHEKPKKKKKEAKKVNDAGILGLIVIGVILLLAYLEDKWNKRSRTSLYQPLPKYPKPQIGNYRNREGSGYEDIAMRDRDDEEWIVIEQIKAAVHRAAGKNQKLAMFHLQVLKNADELAGMDPRRFCKEVSVRESYAAEFRQMIALARLMKEQGIKLNWNWATTRESTQLHIFRAAFNIKGWPSPDEGRNLIARCAFGTP